MSIETTHLVGTLVDAVSATGTSDGQSVADFKYGSVQVSGTFVASVQLQTSNDETNWVTLGAAITVKSIVQKDFYGQYIRAVVTWTSGTSVTVTFIAKR